MKKKTKKKTKIKSVGVTLPEIPIGKLTIQQFEELRGHIERITGYAVTLNIVTHNEDIIGKL